MARKLVENTRFESHRGRLCPPMLTRLSALRCSLAAVLMVALLPVSAVNAEQPESINRVTRDAVDHLVSLGLIAESEVDAILTCTGPAARTADAANISDADEPLACAAATTDSDAIAPTGMDDRYKVISYAAPPSTASNASVTLDQYCVDMASLVTAQLQSESITVADQQHAIEAAMRIVVRSTEMHMEARIDRLKARFERELAAREIDQRQTAAMLDVKNTMQQWMAPVYQHLDRNYRQLQLLSANDSNIDRTLGVLEQLAEQIAPVMKNNSPKQRITLQSSEPRQSAAEVARQRQLVDLQRQLSQAQSAIDSIHRRFIEGDAARLRPIQAGFESSASSIEPASHWQATETDTQPLMPRP